MKRSNVFHLPLLERCWNRQSSRSGKDFADAMGPPYGGDNFAAFDNANLAGTSGSEIRTSSGFDPAAPIFHLPQRSLGWSPSY
jgi:hypothetical protein